jgi:DMSO/TMAO reductase YedYZ molybdopterin-dependent catalytic subunit
MNTSNQLRIDGEVERPGQLSFDDLSRMDEAAQIGDVSRYDEKRRGDAVSLAGLLAHVQAKPTAQYLGLHSSKDDFHASVPLAPILEQAFLIYRVDGAPLSSASGGPFRFFIPDHSACHTDEIDECANVKFVDHIELTTEKGYDNRPEDEEEHERLHAKPNESV